MKGPIEPLKTPRKAATIILVREHEGGLQVYLLRRSPQSSFFPGSYVFPGGAVDPLDSDHTFWIDHVDMDRDSIACGLRGGLDLAECLAYGVAAVRETFEEAGVLLASQQERHRGDLPGLRVVRVSHALAKGWLRDLVLGEDWMLSFSRLSRWSHWITPKAMPKRFDTRFFLALMPPGQTCSPDTRETVEGIWVTPAQALERNLQGEIPLSPPTLVTLQEFLSYPDLRGLLAESEKRQWGEPRLPRLVKFPQGPVIFEPWDPICEEGTSVDPDKVGTSVLPVGEPFSRIWLHEGTWRPVRS